MKATSRRVRLTGDQLDGLCVAAAMAADQTTRQAAADPARQRDRLRAQAVSYRRLAGLLRGTVAADLTLWVVKE